jgi:hypothetical protein
MPGPGRGRRSSPAMARRGLEEPTGSLPALRLPHGDSLRLPCGAAKGQAFLLFYLFIYIYFILISVFNLLVFLLIYVYSVFIIYSLIFIIDY